MNLVTYTGILLGLAALVHLLSQTLRAVAAERTAFRMRPSRLAPRDGASRAARHSEGGSNLGRTFLAQVRGVLAEQRG